MNRQLLYLPLFSSLFILILFDLLIANDVVRESEYQINRIESYSRLLVANATIDVTPKTICLGDTVDITFTGSGGNGNYTFNYEIDGNALTTGPINGNSTTVFYTPTSTGDFDIVLISVAGSDGIFEDVIDESVTITVSMPIVSFTFNNDNACSGTLIQFTSTGTAINPNYLWNFGDGSNPSTEENPTHIFQALGCSTQTFIVTLTVTDVNGCINSETHEIQVKQKPNIISQI